ncbi:hypothetical protein TBR22_A30120 [Luteitalea sp. TBR-22]|uniref:hypothetical protein n=1 Tax=Luteitalea sp. TBR-22 TaxID=2802971 RepID=UPI001AF078A7|nr:hypothetical protein [Luteitalea sp. TBR-22]BCS33785.1 hypothetical protein TBR22_A30120 [Luteitalea sp. TBR-22]
MRRTVIGLVVALAVASAMPARAEVTVQRVACPGQGQCVRMTNGTVEVLLATEIGPRILRYGFVGGDNLLGWVPETTVKTALGDWKPWGGHRLWAGPEHMPRSYSPDNAPVDVKVEGRTATLTQDVEPRTGLRKVMTVTLAETGSGVTVGHRLENTSLWDIQVAPWALTIMNGGGTVILPQEPYASHDDALLPVRQVTLWAYTDLSDPRWQIGPKFLRLHNDAARQGSQKIGIANHQNWAAYHRAGQLFVKRYDWKDGATYPDGGVNTETYTAGAFIELETLGVLASLPPGGSAAHEERWFLFRDVAQPKADDDLARVLAPLLASTH